MSKENDIENQINLLDNRLRKSQEKISELEKKVQENKAKLSKVFCNLDGSNKKTWDEQIAYNRLELGNFKKELSELKKHQSKDSSVIDKFIIRVYNTESVLKDIINALMITEFGLSRSYGIELLKKLESSEKRSHIGGVGGTAPTRNAEHKTSISTRIESDDLKEPVPKCPNCNITLILKEDDQLWLYCPKCREFFAPYDPRLKDEKEPSDSDKFTCKYCKSKRVVIKEEGCQPDNIISKVNCPNCGEIDFTDLVDSNLQTTLYENEYVAKKEQLEGSEKEKINLSTASSKSPNGSQGRVYKENDQLDSKEPSNCEFCGRELIRYNNEWVCGLGYIKPALKPQEPSDSDMVAIEKFIPPKNIKCSDCMDNPIPKLIGKFIETAKSWRKICNMYIDGSYSEDWKDNFRKLRDEMNNETEKWEKELKENE